MRRRSRRRRKKIIKGILVSFLGLFTIFLVFILLFCTREIQVSGNRHCTAQEISDWLQSDSLTANTIYTWFRYNHTDVEQLPFVEESEIELVTPWTIRVRVYEKEVTGCLEKDGEYICFDRDGMVIFLSGGEDTEGIPKIEGLEVDSSEVKVGEQLPVKEDGVFSNVLEISRELQKSELSPDRIILGSEDVTLCLGKVTALLGQGNLDEKIAQIAPILSELEERYPDPAGTLHLENYGTSGRTISFVPEKTEG